MPDNTFDAATLGKRFQFEQVADDAGWQMHSDRDATEFVRDGWYIKAFWLDGTGYPVRLSVEDPNGVPVKSMNYIDDHWAVCGELMLQLKSPGPQRAEHYSLESLIYGYIAVCRMADEDRKISLHAVAERLESFLEEAS